MISANILNGHIFIPPDVDRDKYVKKCYARERVSVVLSSGSGVMHDCYIDKQSLREIVFPSTSDDLGSYVSIIQKRNKIGIILGVISYENESSLMNEDDIVLSRFDKNQNYVGIKGNAKTGNLSVSANNKDSGAILDITILGKNNSGTINIKVNDEFNVRSNSKTNIESFGEVSLKSLNKDKKDEYTGIKISNNDISISSKGTLNIDTEGSVNIVSKGTVDINGGNLTIEA